MNDNEFPRKKSRHEMCCDNMLA